MLPRHSCLIVKLQISGTRFGSGLRVMGLIPLQSYEFLLHILDSINLIDVCRFIVSSSKVVDPIRMEIARANTT